MSTRSWTVAQVARDRDPVSGAVWGVRRSALFTSAMQSLRLADVLAGLSLIADLGVGNEPEKAMRTCLLAVSLAEQLGLGEEERRDVYYAALLEHAGCTGGAHEAAAY